MIDNGVLNVTHNSGFFSCCNVRLSKIIEYFNKFKKEPRVLNCKTQFAYFKNDPFDINEDLNLLFFKKYKTFDDIPYVKDIIISDAEYSDFQFTPYYKINFDELKPFIEKYYSLSDEILNLITSDTVKYNINYDKTIGVCYRGNDKHGETNIASYDDFLKKCSEVYNKNADCVFFLQTDEKEFSNEFYKQFPNTFHLEKIPQISHDKNKVIHSLIYDKHRPMFGCMILASIFMLSQCKHVITHSGNCGMWITLFRSGVKNVHQFLHHHNSNINWF